MFFLRFELRFINQVRIYYYQDVDCMYHTSEIARLIRKKLEGSIGPRELLSLEAWARKSTSNSDLLKKLEDEEVVLEDVLNWLELSADEEEGSWIERLERKTFLQIYDTESIHLPKKRKLYLRLLPYVASLLVASFIGFVYLTNVTPLVDSAALQDLEPGANRAIIALSDGRVIELSEDQEEVVIGEELTYHDGSLISQLEKERVLYSELKTPRGGHYRIALPDGTKVWLNADSKFSYPSRFDGERRVVELEGEAYFEVATSYENERRIPFIVKTEHQEIEVLGTEFNVMAYSEDSYVQTTLVEGAVQLHSKSKSLLLRPGEQGVSEGHTLNKRSVDVDQYLGWKNNEFVFYETELKDALKALSRWYDFDVVYEGSIPQTHLYGSISRNKGLSDVLKIMETSGLGFRIERIADKNKLIVLKQNYK